MCICDFIKKYSSSNPPFEHPIHMTYCLVQSIIGLFSLLLAVASLSFFVLDEADRMIKNEHFRELQSIINMLPEAGDSIGGQSKSLENCETLSTCKERKDRLLFFLQL